MKSLLLTLSISFAAFGGGESCTDWRRSKDSCIFNSGFVDVWVRDCAEQDVKTRLCSPYDPNEFLGVCSEWIEERAMSCLNSDTNSLEQKWIRVCHTGMDNIRCSREKPN